MREDMMHLSRLSSRKPAWRIAALALALAIGAGLAAPAAAQSHLRIAHKALGATQQLQLEVNKSMLVDLPTDVGEVIASQPAVATVVMRSKTRAIVQGVAGGDTNIFFLDPVGNSIAVLDLKVYQPRSDVGNALEAAIARNLPGSAIRVESVLLDGATNRVVLTGTARSQDDLSKATAMAVQFTGSETNVANIATVSGNQQVRLQVVVAEVNREAIRQFGINLDGTISMGPIAASFTSNQPNGLVSGVANSNGIGLGASMAGISIEASLEALERRGALRTLAKPTLSAISGQPAEFHAGGQFPYETRDTDGNRIIAYQDYGVFLNFTPTLRTNGQIQLQVDTSVREPAAGGAVTDRSANTTVELATGQTLAIAGMLQDTVRQQINQMPGLGNIPILGALFRSRDYVRSQTELVILVTPYYSEPTYDTTTPVDRMKIAGDAEAIFLGHLEQAYGGGGMRGSYSGSVGFVLD